MVPPPKNETLPSTEKCSPVPRNGSLKKKNQNIENYHHVFHLLNNIDR